MMARSGINSLEQIFSARMNLTASLYHHHKIRACDCMLKAVFLYCRENGVELCGRRIESAADFLHFTDVGILAEAERATDHNVPGNAGQHRQSEAVQEGVSDFNERFRRPGSEENDSDTKESYNLVHELIGTTLEEQRKLAVAIGMLLASRDARKRTGSTSPRALSLRTSQPPS